MEINHDDLPELGTKAAAVAAIESLIFRAIGAKDLEPLQLRYWLDAYYQARIAAAGWMEAAPQKIEEIDARKVEEAISRWKRLQPHLITRETYDDLRPSPAKSSEQEATPKPDKPLPIIEDEAGPPRASASTVETEYSAAPEDAAETQQKTEPAAKPQRLRPVGWTDGNQLPTDPETCSGAAAAAKFKREQFERLQRFLREGVTMQQIVKAVAGNITEDQILGIRECRRVPVAVYRVLEAALDRIETD